MSEKERSQDLDFTLPPLPPDLDVPEEVASTSSTGGDNTGGDNTGSAGTAIDPLLHYRQEPEPQAEYQPPPRFSSSQFYARGSRSRFWVNFGAALFLVAMAVILVRVFVIESFYITSDSMVPTLKSGDRIMVLKPGSDDPGRGDMVVFSRPPIDATPSDDDLIKRVIALEGETISFIDPDPTRGLRGGIFIQPAGSEQIRFLQEPYLADGAYNCFRYVGSTGRECLDDPSANPMAGTVLFDACVNQTDPQICTVAEGYVYVMGDSRAASYDSRFFGPIKKSSIVGRAFFRAWPIGDLGGL